MGNADNEIPRLMIAGLVIVLLTSTPTTDAQSREGEFEIAVGLLYQPGQELSLENGPTVDTDDELDHESEATSKGCDP